MPKAKLGRPPSDAALAVRLGATAAAIARHYQNLGELSPDHPARVVFEGASKLVRLMDAERAVLQKRNRSNKR